MKNALPENELASLSSSCIHDDKNCASCRKCVTGVFQKEHWFKNIFEHSTTGIVVVDFATQRFLRANRSFLEIVDYSEEELLQKTVKDITHPEDWENEKNLIELRCKNGLEEYCVDKRYITRTGEIKYVTVSGDLLPADDGTIIALANVVDITERVLAKNEMLLDEARLESLLRISNYNSANNQDFLDFALDEAIKLTQSQIGYIYFYNETEKVFVLNSWSKEVMNICNVAEKQTVYELEKTGIWGEVVRQRKPIMVNDFAAHNPLKKGTPEGHAPMTRFLSIPVFCDGKIVAVVGVANKAEPYSDSDIRQLNLMMNSVWQIFDRNKIAEKQQMMAEMIDIAPSSITIHDSSGKFLYANRKTLAMHGYSLEEFLKLNLHDLDVPESEELIEERMRLIREYGEACFEVEHYRKDGSKLPLEVYVRKIAWNNYSAFLSIGTDISERKKSEIELKSREALLNKIFDMLPIGLWFTDSQGKILRGNPAGIAIWGKEPKTGAKYNEVFTARRVPSGKSVESNDWSLVQTLKKGITIKDEMLEIDAFDGKKKTVLNHSAPVIDENGGLIGAVVMNNDITELRKKETAIQKMQKLESLGLLAGGIAHDFNNLLGGIFGFVDLAINLSKEEPVTRYLNRAMESIDRARALTHQLLTFAKGGAPVKKVGALFPFIKETALFALSGSSVSSCFEIDENLWSCDFDKNQIGQVIDNLVINALQAMPDGGKIKISASNIVVFEKDFPLVNPGKYVKISVKDCGIGIPQEVLPKIFDPFFTTKAKGHGLGLATSFSIINRHGGFIDVNSQQGKGTTFHVFLPATEIVEQPTPRRQQLESQKGSGKILVMDDEELMLEIIRDILGSMGYEVITACSGSEAIENHLREISQGRPLSAMIFDLTIPGEMGGKEAIGLVRQIDPDTPVFVASGYAEDPVMRSPAEYGFTASICKPFRRAELIGMLQKYLPAFVPKSI
ncbi:MAG: PAS domain S-box protein [Candidatus Rifleibacteriota bacterium]